MAHWPRTVRTYIYAIPVVIMFSVIFVQLVVALSGTVVWALVAVAVLGSAGYALVSRRLRIAQDLAVADAPSFADALRRRQAADAAGSRS